MMAALGVVANQCIARRCGLATRLTRVPSAVPIGTRGYHPLAQAL